MFCPRCDSPVPQGANFCMRCGNSMTNRAELKLKAANAAAQAPTQPVPVRNTQLGPVLAMAVVVAIVFLLGWGVSSALQARSQQQPALQAPRQIQPNLVATADAPKEMPPRVRDWLEHLRRTEERKNKLNAQQVAEAQMYVAKFQALGPAAGLLSNTGDDDDNTNPAAPAQKITTDMSAPWTQLVKDFQTVPPPPECQKLADEYFAALNEVPAQIQDVQKILEDLTASLSGADPMNGETKANRDALQQAESLQGKSNESIDAHFINADGLLGDVCGEYNTRKWFSISSDFGGGLMNTPF